MKWTVKPKLDRWWNHPGTAHTTAVHQTGRYGKIFYRFEKVWELNKFPRKIRSVKWSRRKHLLGNRSVNRRPSASARSANQWRALSVINDVINSNRSIREGYIFWRRTRTRSESWFHELKFQKKTHKTKSKKQLQREEAFPRNHELSNQQATFQMLRAHRFLKGLLGRPMAGSTESKQIKIKIFSGNGRRFYFYLIRKKSAKLNAVTNSRNSLRK